MTLIVIYTNGAVAFMAATESARLESLESTEIGCHHMGGIVECGADPLHGVRIAERSA